MIIVCCLNYLTLIIIPSLEKAGNISRNYFFPVNMKLQTKLPSSYQQGIPHAATVPHLNMITRNSESRDGGVEDCKYCTKLTQRKSKQNKHSSC